jgi:carbon-monoxide dehydrogenase large subunit
MYVGGAIARTVDAVLEKGRKAAAILLQAGEDEVQYRDGTFSVGGREISLFDVAERSVELARQGVIAESLDTVGRVNAPPSFPNGCHVAEVEVDPDTGAVTIERYAAVDDAGNVLDHTIVAGQVHGGVTQGLGQALTEDTVYERGSGQLISGSFMDYALPRADDVPMIATDHHEVPCRTNPLGVKGAGEAGTTAAPPAIMNAVLNALPPAARRHLDMPATPLRVWRALQSAAAASAR